MEKVLAYIDNISLVNKSDIYKEFIKLLDYLNYNNIVLNIEDAQVLLLSSDKLFNMVDYIKKNYSIKIDDNNLNVFFLSYDLINEKYDDNDVKYIKGTKDIDTIDLYIRNMPTLLTNEEEEKLMQEILSGNKDARDKLVEHNLRLVVYIAKKYVKPGVLLMDLVQDGNIALINSAKNFDPSLGFKFSTYATNNIIQAIVRNYYVSSRVIKLPSYINELILKMYKFENILTNKLNRKPTDDELADALEISLEKYESIKKYATYTLSLDSPVNCDDDLVFLKDIIENTEGDVEEDVIHSQYLEEFRKIVFENKKLKDKEKKVISLRYGFYDGSPKSLKDVASIMNMTREGVRVVEKRALGKILMDKRMRNFYFSETNTELNTSKKDNDSYNRVLKN